MKGENLIPSQQKGNMSYVTYSAQSSRAKNLTRFSNIIIDKTIFSIVITSGSISTRNDIQWEVPKPKSTS